LMWTGTSWAALSSQICSADFGAIEIATD